MEDIAYATTNRPRLFEQFGSVTARHVRLNILKASDVPTIREFQLSAPENGCVNGAASHLTGAWRTPQPGHTKCELTRAPPPARPGQLNSQQFAEMLG